MDEHGKITSVFYILCSRGFLIWRVASQCFRGDGGDKIISIAITTGLLGFNANRGGGKSLVCFGILFAMLAYYFLSG
jgi:hypothetical protein